ncbi:Tigger transposable element-derived protein 6 [Dictyocoela muelleri]|nr:Tigger transposable element-derived protein 6 [Dictyocoela muelleri]
MRITIMLTCSMRGEKLTPLIIGKSKCPRPLKNFDFKEVGVKYTHSPKACMTSILFKSYLNDLDQQMITEKRKILLILDNAQTHSFVQLCNIILMFLPKNTTSIMQPLDMGIIKAFKCHYFNALVILVILKI